MTARGQVFCSILRFGGARKDRFPRVSTSPVSQLYLASTAWIVTRSVLISTSPFRDKKEPSRRICNALKPIDVPASMGTAIENPPLGRLFEPMPIVLIGNHGSDPQSSNLEQAANKLRSRLTKPNTSCHLLCCNDSAQQRGITAGGS